MTYLLYIILQEQIPTESLEKVTNLINKEGASTVLLSIVLVCFLVMFLAMIRRGGLSDSTMKEQLDLIKDMSENLQKMSHILETHTQALNLLVAGLNEEVSANQLQEISELLFSKSSTETLDYIEQIITDNHISDQDRVKLKVENISANLYSMARERAVHFKYKGQPLSYFLKASFKDKVAEAMIKAIYANNGFNRKIAKLDITILFDNIKADFIESINKIVGAS